MKEQTKDSINVLGNLVGYGAAIGTTSCIGVLLYLIKKHKRVYFSEPNPIILNSELGLMGGIIVFLGYKLVKNIRDIVYG